MSWTPDPMNWTRAALLASLVACSFVVYWREREWLASVATVLGSLTLGLTAATGGFSGPPAISVIDVVLTGGLILVLVQWFGVPRLIARPLGLAYRSREWRFDRAVGRLLRPIDKAWQSPPPQADQVASNPWQVRTLRDGRARLARLRRMTPPDDDWARLLIAYLRIYEAILDEVAGGERKVTHDELIDAIMASRRERQRLRAKHEAAMRAEVSAGLMARLRERR